VTQEELEVKTREAARQVNEAIAPSKPEEPKAEEQSLDYSFDVDWTSPQGKRYTGTFKAHIMGVGDTLQVGILRAGLTGGMPPESLDKNTADVAEMVATLQVVVDSGPDWAKDLIGLKEVELVWQMYKEVLQREDRFRGRAAQAS
jgi:hypothetical protein